MNPMKLDVELYQMALEGKTFDDVWRRFRSDKDVESMFGDNIKSDGAVVTTKYKKVLEQVTQKAQDAADETSRTPFVGTAVKLQYRTKALASMLIDAMDQLTLEDPRDIRHAVGVYQKVHQEQNEGVLQQTLDLLEECDAKTPEMQAEFDALFPPQKKDDDE